MLRPGEFRLFVSAMPGYTRTLGFDIHVRDSLSSGFVRNNSTNYLLSIGANQVKSNFPHYGVSAVNENGSARFLGVTNQIPISMMVFGQSLTITQAENFDTAFSNYITAI
jgi:hypothetical protein